MRLLLESLHFMLGSWFFSRESGATMIVDGVIPVSLSFSLYFPDDATVCRADTYSSWVFCEHAYQLAA